MKRKALEVLALGMLALFVGVGIAYCGAQADKNAQPPLAQLFTETAGSSVRDLIRDAGR